MLSTPAPTPTADPMRSVPARAWLIVAILLALLLYIFRVPLAQMVSRWQGEESYYSHGFLVPFVALYLMWRDRARLLTAPRRTYWPGLLLVLGGLLLYVVAGFFSVFFLGAFAFVITLWGIGGLLLGGAFLRLTLFPMFVLLFMVPLPMFYIDEISLRMKLFAANAAVVLMSWIGIVAARDGSVIYLNDAVVTVGAACSGLRSLISLIFLGVLFAYLVNLTLPRKIILFFASMPIAIVANIIRVLILCLIANQWGSKAITPLIHDGSGYLIFVIAFALLWLTVRLLSLGGGAPPDPITTSEQPPTLPASAAPAKEHANV
jgi:exosortase